MASTSRGRGRERGKTGDVGVCAFCFSPIEVDIF